MLLCVRTALSSRGVVSFQWHLADGYGFPDASKTGTTVNCTNETARPLPQPTPGTVGTVAHVVDGDTVKSAAPNGLETTIRLEGIDAPECRSALTRIDLFTDAS